MPEGIGSPVPARIEFRVPRPFWAQWWFASLVLGLAAASAYGWHRFRLRQFLALERIRRQIALDLHDDIGSRLSEIAILSEVVKRGADPAAVPLLEQTAQLARGMRESMSDIVWAVDPRKDRLGDLVQRMRQASFNLLGAAGVQIDLTAPAGETLDPIMLAPDRRRHLLLMYKETLTNIARHARAGRVRVVITLEHGDLIQQIEDDGIGFDPDAPSEGHGLRSLRQRALELGGEVTIHSAPGAGTRVRVRVPLRR